MKTLGVSLAPPSPASEAVQLHAGELVARPFISGRRVVLAFVSPYELFITVDGSVIPPRPDREQRRILIEAWRGLPALYASLAESCSLVAVQTPRSLVACDLYDRVRQRYLSHEAVLARCERIQMARPPGVYLGQPASERALRRLLEEHRALGPEIELRREEDGLLVEWTRVSLGSGATRRH